MSLDKQTRELVEEGIKAAKEGNFAPTPPWTDALEYGDVVVAKKNVSFVDGTYHIKGNKYVVTELNRAYFEVNHKDYKSVE